GPGSRGDGPVHRKRRRGGDRLLVRRARDPRCQHRTVGAPVDDQQGGEMTNPYTLEGRTALVTGGAQGIGAAIAQGLVEAGARVFVCDRNAEIGEATAKDLGAEFVAADVTDSASIDAAVEHVVATAGSLDVAVNNAGIVHNHPSEDLSDEDWRRVMSVNLDGVFYSCRAEGRRMLAQGSGSIINTGSMSGHIANRPQP